MRYYLKIICSVIFFVLKEKKSTTKSAPAVKIGIQKTPPLAPSQDSGKLAA